jgi:hypothetical protein
MSSRFIHDDYFRGKNQANDENMFATHMKALLNNERAPVTFGGGFIQARFPQCCEAYTSVWRQYKTEFETVSFEADLKEAMLRLEPLQMPQNRYLMTETQSNWTAIFSNSRLGSDVTSSIYCLCKALGCLGVTIQCSPSLTKRVEKKTSIVSYAATSFTLEGPHETEWLNEIRHVSARKDGGPWKFFQRGEVQSFEQVYQYQNKHIRDRFTPEMLETYCAALGIFAFDETFYGRKSFLLHQLTKFPSTSPKWTFQQAHAYLYDKSARISWV